MIGELKRRLRQTFIYIERETCKQMVQYISIHIYIHVLCSIFRKIVTDTLHITDISTLLFSSFLSSIFFSIRFSSPIVVPPY